MKTRLLVCVLAVFALFATGCGSDSSNAQDVAVDAATSSETTEDAMEEEAMADDDHSDEDHSDDDHDDHSDEDHSDDDHDDHSDEDHSDDAMEEETMEEGAMADDAMADGPQRIISLSPTATEMLYAIGAGDRVIAVDSFSNYPEGTPITDLSAWEPNLEAIAGMDPDLVVTAGPIEGLADLGIENFVAPAVVDLDGIYSQIEQFGAVTGNVGEAAEVVLRMQTDIEEILATVPERETPLTYYHELDNTLYSVTSGTFIGYVYDLFGLVNVADPADADGSAFGYPQLNREFLLDADPDLIFLADTICCEQTAATASAREGWDALAAVQNGNVVELNDDIVSRWGPRIVNFMEAIDIALREIETVPAS